MTTMTTQKIDPLIRNNVHVLGSGPSTIVLAHGFGSDQTAWRHQAAELGKSHRVVLFDHVGANAATIDAYSPRRYRSLHGYSDDLLEILAELDVNDAFYVGHSMSGMIGILSAIVEPERFSRLVVLAASPRYLNDPETGYHGGFEPAAMERIYSAMAAHYQAWASGFAGLAMGNADRPELHAEFRATLSAIRPDIAVAVARVIFSSDHRADLPRMTRPTLVVQTHQDIAVPLEVGAYLARHLPHAELKIIDSEGHLPHMSAPSLVLDAIRAFLP